MTGLSGKLLAVHAALDSANLPHAFGGAIALAYCVLQPRGTADIDVNVWVATDRSDDVIAALPAGVKIGRDDRERLRRDGQVRLMWNETPIDIFLETHEFHREASHKVRGVPFESTQIFIIACETLMVFKAMFNRTQDWADIEAILRGGGSDGRNAHEQLRMLLGPADPAVIRLGALIQP